MQKRYANTNWKKHKWLSEKVDLGVRNNAKDTEGHFKIKGSIHQQDIVILNMMHLILKF